MRPIALIPFLLASGTALAEGTEQLGVQTVQDGSIIFVDILNSSSEVFTYEGLGRVQVNGPDGSDLGLFSSGEVVVPTAGDGAYQVEFLAWQTEGWDITVEGALSGLGRVHAYEWNLDAQEYTEDVAFDGSFFALVQAGGPEHTNTIEMQAEGLAGYQWRMAANSAGVEGADGRSQADLESSYVPEYPIYLQPPEIATHTVQEPVAGELTLIGGTLECDSLAPGETTGTFIFESDVEGSYHIVCDLDDDGDFDMSSDDDLTLSGEAVVGENTHEWDGSDNGGAWVGPGAYDCQLTITVGEFHYVADDIETSFSGIRMFQVDSSGIRSPLNMFWNDTAVQDRALDMPNGEKGLVTSGSDGMSSGPYSDSFSPNRNARSWGAFQEAGKGNVSLLDTYVWLAESTSGKIDVNVIDPDLDTDGDGISDIEELCELGTDPYEVAGYFRGGCTTAPKAVAPAAALLAFMGLIGLRRRED